MKFINWLKEKLENSNSKTMINNLAVVVIICIIILISWSAFFPKEDQEAQDNNVVEKTSVENHCAVELQDHVAQTHDSQISTL